MAVSIGCEYDIHKIKREHFCRKLKNIGIGEKLAMKHYDDMLSRIESALEESCETLMQTGIYTGKRHEKKDFRGAKAGVDVKKDICQRKNHCQFLLVIEV